MIDNSLLITLTERRNMHTYGQKKNMKSELLFERNGMNITTLETGNCEHFKTINEAKRKSVLLQESNGGLGCGSMRVIR